MKRQVQQVETVLGVGLSGSVTTCVDKDKYKCEITYTDGDQTIYVNHKGKEVLIPLGMVKQILLVSNENKSSDARSSKTA